MHSCHSLLTFKIINHDHILYFSAGDVLHSMHEWAVVTPNFFQAVFLEIYIPLWKVGVWGLHRGLEEVAEIPSPKVAVGVQVQLQCR